MIWKAGEKYEIVERPLLLQAESADGYLKFHPGEVLIYRGCRTRPDGRTVRLFSPSISPEDEYFSDQIVSIDSHLRRL